MGEYPYQRLVPSSHSSVSGHSGDPVESSGSLGMVGGHGGGGHWAEDHISVSFCDERRLFAIVIICSFEKKSSLLL